MIALHRFIVGGITLGAHGGRRTALEQKTFKSGAVAAG
jgi:hypothetical protein